MIMNNTCIRSLVIKINVRLSKYNSIKLKKKKKCVVRNKRSL